MLAPDKELAKGLQPTAKIFEENTAEIAKIAYKTLNKGTSENNFKLLLEAFAKSVELGDVSGLNKIISSIGWVHSKHKVDFTATPPEPAKQSFGNAISQALSGKIKDGKITNWREAFNGVIDAIREPEKDGGSSERIPPSNYLETVIVEAVAKNQKIA